MPLLLIVSVVWAFSPGLIKHQLAGLDPTAVATLRIALAALVFLPFLRLAGSSAVQRLQLAATGAFQFGFMYVFYLHAFRHLQAFEVALFTITTPIYLTLIDAVLERRIQRQHWIAAFVSIAGAAVIVWRGTASSGLVAGALLVQLSNLCFAAGQVAYTRIRSHMTTASHASSFAWLYLGGLVVTALTSATVDAWNAFRPASAQWLVLVYLGLLASGVCFFLWNRGATLVNTGTLAVMNNAKIPLMVLCSVLFFKEQPDWPRLVAGSALMALAVWMAERKPAVT